MEKEFEEGMYERGARADQRVDPRAPSMSEAAKKAAYKGGGIRAVADVKLEKFPVRLPSGEVKHYTRKMIERMREYGQEFEEIEAIGE